MPRNFMRRLKDYGLPISIVIGVLAYRWIAPLVVTVPYLIMAMLFLTFLKIRVRELRLTKVHFILAGWQLFLALGSYFLLREFLPISVAQGAFNCFLCPAASASPVVIALLGGNVAVGTSYVLLTSVGIAFVAPFLFAFVGVSELSFWESALRIFSHILPIMLLPMFLTQLIRVRFSRLHNYLQGFSFLSFWIWVAALSIIIAKTVEYMLQKTEEAIPTMLILALVGLVSCVVQFAIGKWYSKKYLGESLTLGQSMGQKNSSLAIWMAQVYLDPLSSVAMAAYSVWQNLFNSWELMKVAKRERMKMEK